MKTRLANKRIKNSVLLNLWMKSMCEWTDIVYPVEMNRGLRETCVDINDKFYEYDREQLIKLARKMNIRYRQIRYYYLYRFPYKFKSIE